MTVWFDPGASCCTFRQSCLRRCDAATPSPVGPGGLSAQLHVRARALPSPCSVTSSTRPSTGRFFEWRGWDSNPRSRAHEAREDSRSSTARRSPAGERGSGRQDSNLRSPTPEVGGVGQSPLRPVAWGTMGSATSYSPAGIEPAPRGVEALCSSAELRGDRRPWNRTTLHRRIRAAPTQSACRRGLFASGIPPSGIPRSDPRRRRGTSLKASASPSQLRS